MFAIALLANSAKASKAETSHCGQGSELAAARLRWATGRQSRVNPVDNDKNGHAYGIHFYEVVTARYAVSSCKDGVDRQPILDLLDSEIDAFNNLIAAQCGG